MKKALCLLAFTILASLAAAGGGQLESGRARPTSDARPAVRGGRPAEPTILDRVNRRTLGQLESGR